MAIELDEVAVFEAIIRAFCHDKSLVKLTVVVFKNSEKCNCFREVFVL